MGRAGAGVWAERKVVTDGLLAARQAAIEDMNPALRRRLKQLEGRLSRARESNLRFYYVLGQICDGIQQDPEKYGPKAFKLIETAMSTEARTLRKAAQFARTYSETELEGLISLYHADSGFQLHWGHVTYLLILPTKALREDYSEKAVEGVWDPLTLHEAIKKKMGTRDGNVGGRPLKMPATVSGQLRQIRRTTEAWVNKQTKLWNSSKDSAFSHIQLLPPDEYTTDILEDLTRSREASQKMADEAESNVKRLDRLIVRARKCIARREKRAAADAAAKELEAENERRTGGRRSRRIEVSGSTASVGSRAKKAAALARS